MDYISRKAFAESIGLKDSTVRGWQERHWTKGVHYTVVGRTTLLKTEAVNEWLENHYQRDCVPAAKASRSESKPVAGSTKKPLKATSLKIISPQQ